MLSLCSLRKINYGYHFENAALASAAARCTRSFTNAKFISDLDRGPSSNRWTDLSFSGAALTLLSASIQRGRHCPGSHQEWMFWFP